MARKPIKEFCGLRPKLYSILDGDEKEKMTCKGVVKSVVRRNLTHQLYVNTLLHETDEKTEMFCIRSYNHQLKTVSIKKVSLSPFDDKRHILQDKISTLAIGHTDSIRH